MLILKIDSKLLTTVAKGTISLKDVGSESYIYNSKTKCSIRLNHKETVVFRLLYNISEDKHLTIYDISKHMMEHFVLHEKMLPETKREILDIVSKFEKEGLLIRR